MLSVSRKAIRSGVLGVGVYTLPLRVLTCGKDVGIDKGSFVKMVVKAFTCSGTKRMA